MASTLRLKFPLASSLARSALQPSIYRARRTSYPISRTWKSQDTGWAPKSTVAAGESTRSHGGESDLAPFEYEFVEDVERLEEYRPGGYHPISIGETLRERYRVVHKLGYGTYSTAWLCRDGQSDRYVAAKIGTSESNPREVDILEFLNSDGAFLGHPDRKMIPSVRDRFLLHGPNATHPCYINDPARCSISGAKDGSYRRVFQADTVRSIIAQLILAIEYMHARGMIHGDIHLGNILLGLSDGFDQLSVEKLHDKYRRPAPELVARLDGQDLGPGGPPPVIPPIWLGKASEEYLPERSGFCSPISARHSPLPRNTEPSPTPRSPSSPQRPPSHLTEASLSPPTCGPLRAPHGRPSASGLFSRISSPRQTTSLPSRSTPLADRCPRAGGRDERRGKSIFTEQGQPIPDRHVRTWEDRLESHIQRPRREIGIPELDGEEKAAAMDMLCSMLRFRPEDRATARDVLGCEWMTRWAVPEWAGLTR